jgi:hypothetical protein
MSNDTTQPWLMRLISRKSSVIMIDPFILRFSSEGDLVLVFDQDKDPLAVGKFKPMWFRPFIVKEVLNKCTYRLVEFEGKALVEPRNGFYLKKYYS